MTVYATVGSSLQQGDVAPGTAVNSGQALAPYRTNQQEIGYKISWPLLDFSTAWFRLERPFATVDPADNVFRNTGDQLNYGIEAMLTGRLGTRLVTYGGFTVLDPKLTDTPAGGQRQALRRHPDLEVESADRVSRAGRPGDVSDAELAARRAAADRRREHRVPSAYNVVDAGVRYAMPSRVSQRHGGST